VMISAVVSRKEDGNEIDTIGMISVPQIP
jgi:hypothetical protein